MTEELASRLGALRRLLDDGTLTQEEFEQAKNRVLEAQSEGLAAPPETTGEQAAKREQTGPGWTRWLIIAWNALMLVWFVSSCGNQLRLFNACGGSDTCRTGAGIGILLADALILFVWGAGAGILYVLHRTLRGSRS